jgi:hypothetical protein
VYRIKNLKKRLRSKGLYSHRESVKVLTIVVVYLKIQRDSLLNTVTCRGVIIDGVLYWILDLLTTYTQDLQVHVITAPPLISTIHKSPQRPLNLSQPAVSSPAVSW